jgi:tetratricopeptide (TPR) repeat protein
MGDVMARLAMALVALALISPAQAQQKQAQPKQYCTPEAYLPDQIEKSMKVCDAIIADSRQPAREKIQAYQNRGDLYLRKQEYSSSLQNFNQAIALLATQKIVPYRGFGGPAPRVGEIDDIQASSVYRSRAWLFVNQKQHARAIEDYTKSLQIRPQDRDMLYSRAMSYQELGQYDRAMEDIDKAIAIATASSTDIYPRDVKARAELFLKKGDYDRAIRDFDKTIELNAKTNQTYVDKEVLANRAAAYLAKGDADRALQDLNKAIVGNEGVARYRHHRGLAYRKKGDVDRALEEFSAAIKSASPNDNRAEFLVNRADIWKEKAEWFKAFEDYQSALTINPSHAAAAAGRDAARLAISRPAPSIAAAPPAVSPALASPAAKPASIINERRVALIIGNGSYQSVTALPNPRRDAETLAQALRGVGFQSVQVAADLTRDRLAQALQAFAAEADRADWAVVYFAGHGIEIGGVNYLIPTDARLKADRDVPLETVALDQVLATVAGAKKLRLVVLDACRDNPFVARMTRTIAGRSIGRGLASIEPEGGTLVAFAAKHGQTALDGAQGGNSPFVSALVKHLQSPNVEISKMFRLVRDDVLASTGKQQEPFTYGSLPGQDFFFRVQ